ncbi:choloylglycine hydrolase [Alkalilimnicola ehrlichii]|uniref:Choloylglycine hydrolase n=1 Tax=Alkalilimnicola ehrlichii TaxID=351052 RepID=A0A3E0WQ70_9GAMM|nr:linear amide C-N hydrolase [Alkalilimnicola ehrlichii]RFA26994.1 choloylglycine hydrolase [Alkalilimnicola ehrlichii]RFA34115.1 choloylglycine hydrolase [Alkalilimnicola ehrlichii]
MCTRVLWDRSGQGVLVGRNMDWMEDMRTRLWVLPRGAQRLGTDNDPNPLRWSARYGSLVATAYDEATTDGMNEKGLATHLLWLTESAYGERDQNVPALSIALWAQFFLDRFASVAECVEYLATQPFQVRPQVDPNTQRWATVHLAIDDPSGDSAIIEYIDGQCVTHHDRNYRVMTNSPPFDQQLEHLRHYQGLGGSQPLPGTTEAADRFVRASYYVGRLPAADTPMQAYAALLSVMRNAAQPFGVPDPTRPHMSQTIWRTLADLTRRIYAFESSFSPNIVWTRIDELDFEQCQRLDLTSAKPIGDVTDRFVPAEPFAFASA